jgi:aminopeptidase N
MKMLENEIGDAAMTKALAELVKQRRGIKTEWSDVARFFNKDWFFEQWVYGKQFPKLEITRGFTEPGPRGGFVTTVDITQSGTPKPFRMKVAVVLTARTGEKSQVVDLTKAAHTFYIETDARPSRVTLDPFGYTLAEVPAPRAIGT